MTAYKRKASPSRRQPKKKGGMRRVFFLVVLAFFALLPFYYGYVAKIAAPAWRWISNLGSNPKYRVYKDFNIRIPTQYAIHGIDVSSYQGHINWQLVKNMRQDSVHINFAFIKATEGLLQVDPYFERNWHEAPKAGIVCGAYHYFRPKMNGKWQARFFYKT